MSKLVKILLIGVPATAAVVTAGVLVGVSLWPHKAPPPTVPPQIMQQLTALGYVDMPDTAEESVPTPATSLPTDELANGQPPAQPRVVQLLARLARAAFTTRRPADVPEPAATQPKLSYGSHPWMHTTVTPTDDGRSARVTVPLASPSGQPYTCFLYSFDTDADGNSFVCPNSGTDGDRPAPPLVVRPENWVGWWGISYGDETARKNAPPSRWSSLGLPHAQPATPGDSKRGGGDGCYRIFFTTPEGATLPAPQPSQAITSSDQMRNLTEMVKAVTGGNALIVAGDPGQPYLVDLDGDGVPDGALATSNTIIGYPYNLDVYSGHYSITAFPNYNVALPPINNGEWTYVWGDFFGKAVAGGTGGKKSDVADIVTLLTGIQPGEELWIIEKTPGTGAARRDTERYTGALSARFGEGESIQEFPLPLQHTNVAAAILGYIATVDVTQQYANPYSEKIEAVYTFPLPDNAAVTDFLMTIGDRTIRGIIREREQAQRIYAAARAQGHVASLMTQQRPNIFTQSVANIEPGHEIDIHIKYFNTLAYADGWYEFVFPMVVAPRFNPPGTTDGVGAVAFVGPLQSSEQETEVQYLRPTERSGHDIMVTVDLDAGVALEDLLSVNHDANVTQPDDRRAVIQLAAHDTLPNKDFVLRYKVAGERVKSALVTHRDDRGGFFTLMLYPPAELAHLDRAPLEMIFVVDCSGSMSGEPIAQAKAAVRHALQYLRPDGTFQVIDFSETTSQLGEAPLPATPENIAAGLAYVDSLDSSGGTMMLHGIRAALDFPHDPGRERTVAFLTDGMIGNEVEILAAIYERLGESRIFSFGVGSSPNRYLLERMAALGEGAAAFLSLTEDATLVMDEYLQRISHPALTDIELDWGGLEVTDVYPQRIPDLFVGRPVVLTGRFAGDAPATVRIIGDVAGQERELTLDVDPTAESATHVGLPAVWARLKIMELMNGSAAEQNAAEKSQDWVAAIRQVALDYGLMSNYTAFVAVDSLSVTAGESGTTVVQPVPVPAGVQFETTVSESVPSASTAVADF